MSEWEREVERRALTDLALNPDASPHRLDRTGSDEQPNPCPLGLAGQDIAQPREALEDPLPVPNGDPGALVGDRQSRVPVRAIEVHTDLAVGASELHGVLDQMLDRMAHALSVGPDDEWALLGRDHRSLV